ncbi:MOSC domain-containing protein [Hyunsoonleella sp. 2307UL5-6]|uniref:MOSC domain-containing protein n=1 Tax=Hyunsoonleella sp. 2307UL5-6 TaxID=3384768 RepID=UPI0039BC6675
MYIESTNISKPKTILWKDKEINTGIYKTPTHKAIYLSKTGIVNDYVADTKVHGGIYKACYLFSSNQYPYWENIYPNLKWHWGMFGENLTVNGMDEKLIMVGDIYRIGDAVVQVTQPREPCFKFGFKFGNQNIITQFINHGFSGTYVRVLEEGLIHVKDNVELIDRLEKTLSVAQLYAIIFSKINNRKLLEIAVTLDTIPFEKREQLRRMI